MKTGNLESKCQFYHCQCSDYIDELQQKNTVLASQVEQCMAGKHTDDRFISAAVTPLKQYGDEIITLKEQLQIENQQLRKKLLSSRKYGEIIGESRCVKDLVSLMDLVSATDASVLIQGESGTGKELVAKEIHRHSGRSDKPFIKVNCSAIPGDLYESEFFGHVRGAFTGAMGDRMGRFEAADGGTIFLDEIAEMPLSLQSKLLRVLQEGEYERLGDDKSRRVDVRVIAATNKKLEQEVKNKKFRKDLFFRLNVFPLEVPPLRQRLDDIPLLACHFIEKLKEKNGVCQQELTEEHVHVLTSYNWPGNVRELGNIIERALILYKNQKLDFKALIQPGHQDSQYRPSSKPVEFRDHIMTDNEIQQLAHENMIKALERCQWKISGKDGAASLLGIKPTTLIERMKRKNISRPCS